MKKSITKFTSIILSFIFLFSGVFSLVASADTITDRGTCMEDHFSRLNALDGTDRLPPNPIGSCTYVAMSMLLSFYDSYWSERFVVDELEWDQGTYNSLTNVISETFNASSESSEWSSWAESNNSELFRDDFHGFVSAKQGEYLQPYLISIGKQQGYHQDLSAAYGLIAMEMVNVLKIYLYDIRNFSENEVTVQIQRAIDVGQDALEDTIMQKLENGIPVIYCSLLPKPCPRSPHIALTTSPLSFI